MTVLPLAGNEELIGAFSSINKESWPNFLLEGSQPVPYCWPTIMSEFPWCQLILVDDDGAAMAVSNGVPIVWDGTVNGLPSGWDDTIVHSFSHLNSQKKYNTLVALSITISNGFKGKGISYTMLQAMKQAAAEKGFRNLIVPVRPSMKTFYALTAIENYMCWKDESGNHFDPWIRAHLKSGGRIMKICHQSMTVKASISEWENWTSLKFPESGKYIIPKALNPVDIFREKNYGLYIEPNVWVKHEIHSN